MGWSRAGMCEIDKQRQLKEKKWYGTRSCFLQDEMDFEILILAPFNE
jgi:hypothetical protein